MSTVFIPAVLRANVGGVKSLELEGDSIRAVVGALVEQHPSLGSQLPCLTRRTTSFATSISECLDPRARFSMAWR